MLQKYLISLLKLPGLKQITFFILNKVKNFSIEFAKRADKNFVRPRTWSNNELKKFSHLFKGNIINVSGWKDEDKEGKKYKDYFINVDKYFVSNYYGNQGYQNQENEMLLDLENPIDNKNIGKFDVVFNHTVLEHVFNIEQAVKNLCDLSKDIVILVTPFIQPEHYIDNAYNDYWRPTTQALNKMLKDNDFNIIYQSSNNNSWYHVYIFTIAVKSGSTSNISEQLIDYYVGNRMFNG
jgi:SAM-dependent methyltransferase